MPRPQVDGPRRRRLEGSGADQSHLVPQQREPAPGGSRQVENHPRVVEPISPGRAGICRRSRTVVKHQAQPSLRGTALVDKPGGPVGVETDRIRPPEEGGVGHGGRVQRVHRIGERDHVVRHRDSGGRRERIDRPARRDVPPASIGIKAREALTFARSAIDDAAGCLQPDLPATDDLPNLQLARGLRQRDIARGIDLHHAGGCNAQWGRRSAQRSTGNQRQGPALHRRSAARGTEQAALRLQADRPCRHHRVNRQRPDRLGQ